jgi:phospholipid/cholesterol/gamma-HCH transport system substrate-binding protein
MATIRPAAVGGFILGALALGVAGILFFGGSHLFARTSRIVVFFNGSVAGLDVGAPVTFRGVRVGSVERIALRFSADTMTARIPVFLQLQSDAVGWEGAARLDRTDGVRRLVDAGLRAQLSSQSIVTGQLGVDLDFRPDTPAQLVGVIPGTAEIPAVQSGFDRLRNELTDLPLRQLVDTAQQTFSSLNQLSEHLDARLDPLGESVQRAADAATRTLETTNSSVRRLQAGASVTLQQLDELIADARRQLNGRGNELARSLADADRTVRQAELLLASLNSLAAPRSQFRGDLEATVRDMAASASSLRTFARAVERDPSALLTGRNR